MLGASTRGKASPAERKAGARLPHSTWSFLQGQLYQWIVERQGKLWEKLAGKQAEESHERGEKGGDGQIGGEKVKTAAFRPKARARGTQTKVRKV